MFRVFCFTLMFVGFFWNPSFSADEKLYSVSGISVDVNSKTVKQAKEEAFKKGKEIAFKKLLKRLTRQNGTAIEVTPSQLDSFVHSSIIKREKTTDVRYIAKLTFNFNKSKIENFLNGQGIDFNPYEVKPILIIPIQQEKNSYLLWENENERLNEWSNNLHHSVLVSFEVPEGNLQDIQDLSLQDALEPNVGQVEKLIRRYNTEGAVVVVHKQNSPADVWYVSAIGDVYIIPLVNGKDKSISEISKAIGEFIRNLSVLKDSERGHLKVIVHVKDQGGWIRTKKTLKQIPAVKTLKVAAMSTKAIDVDIDYVGNLEELQQTLQRHRLKLQTLASGEWALSPEV